MAKRIFAAIPVSGRRELLPLTIGRLLNKCGVEDVYCMGDSPKDRIVCEKAGAIWVDHSNSPLGAKWNMGIIAAIRSGKDYDGFLYVGSSDWVSDNWCSVMGAYLDEYDLIGSINCLFLDVRGNNEKKLIRWAGYCRTLAGDRVNEPIGGGRIYSMRIIKKLNGELFAPELDNSLDYSSMNRLIREGGKVFRMETNDIHLMGISTDRWSNKHVFERECRNPGSVFIDDVDGFLKKNFPEGIQIFKPIKPFRGNLIRQVYCSADVYSFKEGLKEKYDLRDYDNPNEPVLIYGMYNKEDYDFALNHKGWKIIVWCGSDSVKIRPEIKSITARHIATSKFISNDLKGFDIPHEIINLLPLSINVPVVERGNNIYFYGANDPEFYGSKLIDEIKSRTGLSFIKTSGEFSREKIIDFYKQCFIGLRLTPHDGVAASVCELGLMGRKVIHNGNHPNAIHYKGIDDICNKIMIEYARRKEPNQEIAEQMKEWLDTGSDFLRIPKVSVLMNTYNEDETLLRAAIESYINQCHEIVLSVVKSDIKAIKIGGEYSKVKICINENPNIFDQFNNGAKMVTGDYMCYASSNDTALPNKCALEVLKLKQSGKKVCYSSYYRINGGNTSIDLFFDYDYNRHLKDNFVSDCSMVETKLFKKYLPLRTEFDNYSLQDIWLRIYEGEGNVFVYNDIPTWNYIVTRQSRSVRRLDDRMKELENIKFYHKMQNAHVGKI